MTGSNAGRDRIHVDNGELRGLEAAEKVAPSSDDEVLAIANGFCKQLKAIALAEIARKRSRLGPITLEQERALEELLTSTVEKISSPIFDRVRHCCSSGDIQKALAWCHMLGNSLTLESDSPDSSSLLSQQ